LKKPSWIDAHAIEFVRGSPELSRKTPWKSLGKDLRPQEMRTDRVLKPEEGQGRKAELMLREHSLNQVYRL
jgi:hypothetical protein